MKLSDLIGLNPERADAKHSLEARFDALKIRTSALGVVSAAVFGIGMLWGLSSGMALWADWRAASGGFGSASLHIPPALWPDGAAAVGTLGIRAAALVPIALLAVWVLGIWGWSNGRLWGARRYAWMAVVAVLSAVNFTAQSSSFGLGSTSGGAAGKRLSSAAAANRWDAAEAIVTAQPDSGARRYVQAQIALRAGDNQNLRKYAQPLIEQVDFYVMDRDPMLRGVQAQNLAFAKPQVIYALEIGLYGAPKPSLPSRCTNSSVINQLNPTQALVMSCPLYWRHSPRWPSCY
jgi:hypothetical protein